MVGKDLILSKLTKLVLSGTAITDGCADDLTNLTNLKQLVLPQATITSAVIARLRTARLRHPAPATGKIPKRRQVAALQS